MLAYLDSMTPTHKDTTEEFHLNYSNSLHQTTKGGQGAIRMGTWADIPERRTEDAGNHLEFWWKQRIFGIP